MPGLQSFCVTVAIGLGAIYLLQVSVLISNSPDIPSVLSDKIAQHSPCPRTPQVSWFAAWLALDERRIAAGRDGVLPCLVHRDHAPRPAAEGRGARAKLLYTRLLGSPLYKTLVILASLTALGFGVYGWIEIRHRPASDV